MGRVGDVKVAIGSDHGGYNLKEDIKKLLVDLQVEWTDFGTDSREPVDYPDIALQVAGAVARGEYDRGILLCGSGIGMSIAANKVPGIRAALCHDVFSARVTRLDNDSNILTMGERVIGFGHAREVVRAWLETDFSGGRHARRIGKIADIESRYTGGKSGGNDRG